MRPREDGAAAVEFAFVLPILVTLLFAIIQFGLAFFEWQGLQAAAREGARLASYSGSADWSEIEARVLESAAEIMGGTIEVKLLGAGDTWTTPDAADEPCDGTAPEVHIRVSYVAPYEINAIFFNQSVDMAAEAVFHCENAP